MTAIYHPVAPPAVTSRRFGLFSAVEPRTSTIEGGALDDHWRNGIVWQSQACAVAKVTQNACVDPEVAAKTPDDYCGVFEFDPFTVYAFNDDAVPGRTLDEHRADAVARLTNSEELAVEREVWSRLVTAAGLAFNATAFPHYHGLGYAEALLQSQFGPLGLLHMDHMTAQALTSHLRVEGGRLFTNNGIPIIVGGGYHSGMPTLSPTGTIIATGPMVMYRGEIDTRANAVDKAVNRVSIVAERTYVIGWDCLALAVDVSLCDACYSPG